MLAKSLANLPNDYAAVRTFHIDGVSHGRNSRSRSRSRLTNDTRECFGSAWTKIDPWAGALVLCGDLTDTGTPTQAEILARDFRPGLTSASSSFLRLR